MSQRYLNFEIQIEPLIFFPNLLHLVSVNHLVFNTRNLEVKQDFNQASKSKKKKKKKGRVLGPRLERWAPDAEEHEKEAWPGPGTGVGRTPGCLVWDPSPGTLSPSRSAQSAGGSGQEGG